MTVGSQESQTDKLRTLIAGALAGKMNDYRSIHMLLQDRLVVMPILPSSSLWESDVLFLTHPYSEAQVKLPLGSDEHGKVAPIFTTRSGCLEWISNFDDSGESIPVYIADFSKILWKNIRIVLDPGSDQAIMLDRSYIVQTGQSMLGVEQGLYSEFTSEPDPSDVSKMASLTESEPVLKEDAPTMHMPPIPDPIAAAGGIDFRTPEFKAEMAAAAAAAPKRERQGTFTKILDALKAYRK